MSETKKIVEAIKARIAAIKAGNNCGPMTNAEEALVVREYEMLLVYIRQVQRKDRG